MPNDDDNLITHNLEKAEFSKTIGITGILNEHYNHNIDNFELDIDSDNLKTVMLKIGEVPGTIDFENDDAVMISEKITNYYNSLPRIKKQRLNPKTYKANKFTTKDKRQVVEQATIDFEQYSNLVTDKNKNIWLTADNWTKYKLLPANIKGEILEKLRKFDYGSVTEQPKDFQNNILQLGRLNIYLENYGKCRRYILKHIYESWCDEKGNYNKSSHDLKEIINSNSVQKLTKDTYLRIIAIECQDNQNKLNSIEVQELTNAFHAWVRDNICKKSEIVTILSELKMTRLQPNLVEDISGGLVGFFRKLIRAECQYKIELPKLNTFISELKYHNKPATSCPYLDWDKSILFGDLIQNYLAQSYSVASRQSRSNGQMILQKDYQTKNNSKVGIYQEFLESIHNAENLKENNINDLLNFNSVYNQLRTSAEIMKHHAGNQTRFELMFKAKNQIVRLIKTQRDRSKVIEEIIATADGSFALISTIFFDPKLTFPKFESQNSIEFLDTKITELYTKIKSLPSNTNLSIIDITKKKIFKESFVSIQNKEKDSRGKMVPISGQAQILIEKEENTPNGFAHKVFNKYFQLVSKGQIEKDPRGRKIFENGRPKMQKINPKECYNRAVDEIVDRVTIEKDNIYTLIEQGTINQDYSKLRELAGWIWIDMRILIEEIEDFSEREPLIKEISQLSSLISGFAYNLERSGYENQSIYLSDFYTPPQPIGTTSNEFKSNCFLYTNDLKSELGLALGFTASVNEDSTSQKKALVYTFDKSNDKHNQYTELWGYKHSDDLNFFDYEFWNKEDSSAFKAFTKPNLTIGVGDSEFDFPLHFGINQSRKYFWNNVRGTKDSLGTTKDEMNQIHNIFSPNSRLKVSSMRLIRKHNPIRNTWEYYLSLAIYRLEKIETVNLDSKNITVGFDIGKNNLVAYSKVDKAGHEVTINPNLIGRRQYSGHQRLISQQNFDELSKMMKNDNFIAAKTRKKLNNKTESIARQVSGLVTKMVINGEIVDFEEKYKGDKSYKKSNDPKIQVGQKLQKSIAPRARSKLLAELPSNHILYSINPVIKYSDILGIVPDESTSLICSKCGFCNIKDEKLVEGKIAIKPKICLEELVKVNELKEVLNTNPDSINISLFLKHFNNLYQTPDNLFIIETSNLCSKYHEITYKAEIQKWKSEYQKDPSFKITKNILKMFSCRPTWYNGNVEIFRCLKCGYSCECDYQAGLNIARWRVYLEENNIVDIGDAQYELPKFLDWYKGKINNNWSQKIVLPKTNKPEIKESDYGSSSNVKYRPSTKFNQ